MTFLQIHQIEIMRVFGYVCLLLCLFSCLLKDSSIRRKRSLILIEFSAAVLMFSNIYAYQFLGDVSSIGFFVEKFTNFLVFVSVYAILLGLTSYIATLITGFDKLEYQPKGIWVCNVLCHIYLIFVVLSQSWGFFYYFDEQNQYQRGQLYIIGFTVPFLIFLIQLTLIMKYRRYISRTTTIALFAFAVLPIVSALLQVTVLTGTSPMDISMSFVTIILYCFSLMEQNKQLMEASSKDLMTQLPNEAGFRRELEILQTKQRLQEYDIFYFSIAKMGQLNMEYGPKSGDVIIKAYASYIHSHSDEEEVFARLGGNLFVALIQKKHCKSFVDMVMKIPVSVSQDNSAKLLYVSSVVGAYEIPERYLSADTIIGNALAAYHYAKNVYENSVLYLTDEMIENLKVESKMGEEIMALLPARSKENKI